VRVIAATHQNLEERVRQGAFREDLYHRLNVIRLRLPPLRERREDIPALARSFLARSAKELGVDAKRLTEAALARLAAFDFPGNVRQLENVCHWLTVMAPAQVVEEKDLPPELLAQPLRVGAGAGGVGGAAPAHAAAAGPAAEGAGTAAGSPEPSAPAAPAHPAHPAQPAHPAEPAPAAFAAPLTGAVAPGPGGQWLADLEQQARLMLEQGRSEVWDSLSREFESRLILTALQVTRGRRIEAAQRLGIGRNTITRKIQELRLDDA
jgi:two-component system nitrogen regulation response regulator GlnG